MTTRASDIYLGMVEFVAEHTVLSVMGLVLLLIVIACALVPLE